MTFTERRQNAEHVNGYQSETRKHDPPSTPNWRWAAQPSSRKSTIFRLLRLALFVTGGFVIWLNVMPYMDGVSKLLEGDGMHPLIQFLARVPVIGWMVNLLRSITASLIGIALWGVFQIIELLPLFLLGSQRNIRQVIVGLSQRRLIPMIDSDPEFIRKLKVKHNRLPATWLSNAKKAASLVYIVDAAFCLWYYPPLTTEVKLWLMAPSMGDVDFKNLILAGATLIAVELVIACWLWLHNGQQFLRVRRDEDE